MRVHTDVTVCKKFMIYVFRKKILTTFVIFLTKLHVFFSKSMTDLNNYKNSTTLSAASNVYFEMPFHNSIP